jgi:hypothetical protein
MLRKSLDINDKLTKKLSESIADKAYIKEK